MCFNSNVTLRNAFVILGINDPQLDAKSIQLRYIESVLVEIGNSPITIQSIREKILNNFNMTFLIDEILDIITCNVEKFDIVKTSSDLRYHEVHLKSKEFEKLSKIKNETNIFDFINLYASEIYKGSYHYVEVEEIITKYLYDIANTNTQIFSKILGNPKHEDYIPSSLNYENEKKLIVNGFINWDNSSKNIALYNCLSYSLEYCLISNNADSTHLEDNLKKKVFYLDNNVLFRLIGLNGNDHKQEIEQFILKSIKNGQKFCISVPTLEEFKESVKHNIRELSKINYQFINIEALIQLRNLPNKFDEYFLRYRKDNTQATLVDFEAHINVELKKTCAHYNIKIDDEYPFDIDDTNIKEELRDWESGLESFKQNQQYQSHSYDVRNIKSIQILRKGNNIDIATTKYYLISTDFKLLNFDGHICDKQPRVLLPTHWMSLLLKFTNRTDDDFDAFSKFIKINGTKKAITIETLNAVLQSAASLAKDPQTQSFLISEIATKEFDERIYGKTYEEKVELAVKECNNLLEKRIHDHKLQHKAEKKELIDRHAESVNELKKQSEIQRINDKIDKNQSEILNLQLINQTLLPIFSRINNLKRIFKFFFYFGLGVIYLLLSYLLFFVLNIVYQYYFGIDDNSEGHSLLYLIPIAMTILFSVLPFTKNWCKSFINKRCKKIYTKNKVDSSQIENNQNKIEELESEILILKTQLKN